ncbi:hypothetical protein [Escherichia phage dw-ec]|nr:hypothetical protein [Escherichia phage dw-ec]
MFNDRVCLPYSKLSQMVKFISPSNLDMSALNHKITPKKYLYILQCLHCLKPCLHHTHARASN